MTQTPHDPDLLRFVANWKAAGPELEWIRREELAGSSTIAAVRALAGAFRYARRHLPPRPTSGLVEQQQWFRRLAR